MRWGGFRLLLAGSLLLGGAVPAFAQEPDTGLKRCTKLTSLTDTDGTVVTSSPAIVCSVDFIATASNGWYELVDSPNGLITHQQARIVAENGAATAFNSAPAYFGDLGRLTYFGLTAVVKNGQLEIHWDD